MHHFTLRCSPGRGSSDDDQFQCITQDANAVSWLWCRAKVISHWSSALAWRTTHLTWVPCGARAACRDTLAGCDLVAISAFLGLPGSGPRLFHFLPCRPFRQTGLARGAHRRGATKTSHRDGTGCDLRRCGGALPPPTLGYTFQPDFHRDFFPAFNQTAPNSLSFRGFESAVSPAPTWAGLGRARSMHPHSHSLSLSGLGAAALHHQPSNPAKPTSATTIRKLIQGCLLATA